MSGYQSTAASVARMKEKNPQHYCPKPRCLWRTGGGYCPRHTPTESPSLVPQLEASIERVKQQKESA